jgi:2',3'-cyclic-nucleotide 2'-phosphodiesterase (5'-nucleotidase family)
VALANLGKVPGEEMCTEVEGLDVMILGRDVPLIQNGRMIGTTLAVYGGEQGQYMARTLVTLDAGRKVTAREAGVFMLGPQIPDQAAMTEMVKGFQSAMDRKKRESAVPAPAEVVR